MNNLKKSILKTLAYADIFDYPLTAGEVWRFLISPASYSQKQVDKALLYFSSKEGYYFLKGRKLIVDKRQKREKESKKKLQIVKNIIMLLRVIPWVTLIGVSGNLAMNNAVKRDDIDFFIITKKSSLWTTRMFVVFILKALGKHRGKNQSSVSDKICINMLVDESMLTLPKSKQNLYTAHEVVQMKSVFERNNTYQKFLAENSWVEGFLPNSLVGIRNQSPRPRLDSARLGEAGLISHPPFLLEWFAKKLQLWYMRKNRSIEYISDSMLAFHPKDYTYSVLQKYQQRLKRYGKI